MKHVSLNQLLSHPKCDTVSFFLSPLTSITNQEVVTSFLSDVEAQLGFQNKPVLAEKLTKCRQEILKIQKLHPERSYGFFLSENLFGYVTLDNVIESFCISGSTFHVRPLLEELFVNPEFMIVNVSLYDIKIYRGDFKHVEIVQQFEFDQLPKNLDMDSSRLFVPQYLGLLPYKTILAIKTIAAKIKDLMLYNSQPIIVTGLPEMKEIFLRYFNFSSGVVTHLQEDFYEKTCVEILERCRDFRPVVMDYYSGQLKERLKRMLKSKLLITDLKQIILATGNGEINHLVLPVEKKLWGKIDFSTGEYEIHAKPQKKIASIDILNVLAEEVIKQGGRIQILRPHFFPVDSHVLAIIKGSL